MYSLVLVLALNGQPDPVIADDSAARSKHSQKARDTKAYRGRRRGCCGCSGAGYAGCHGGCYGGGYGGGCHGGCHGGYAATGYYGEGYASSYGGSYGTDYSGTYVPNGASYNGNPSGYYGSSRALYGDRYYSGSIGRGPAETPAPREGVTRSEPRPSGGVPRSDASGGPVTERPEPGVGGQLPRGERPSGEQPTGERPNGTPTLPAESNLGPTRSPDRAFLHISLPERAALFINDAEMGASDSLRNFYSPPLKPDGKYTYTLRAEMVRNGKRFQAVKDVAVQPGKEVAVNLTNEDFQAVQ
jgi:uncharacterized protein (TIGR03000 family)